jgi:hypothetical protein
MPSERGAIIQAIGPQNLAQATLGLRGGDVPQNILVPDLTGTIELGRRGEPELLFEQDIVGWRCPVQAIAGGAATFTSIELLNPPGAITVFWMTPILSQANLLQLCIGVPAQALPNGFPTFPIDLRVARAGIVGVPTIRAGAPNALINANIVWKGQLPANLVGVDVGPFIMGEEDILGVSQHFVWEMTIANVQVDIQFHGYTIPKRAK